MVRPKKRCDPAVFKSLRNKSILLVDDNQHLLASYRTALKMAGFLSVHTAARTKDAWLVFRAGPLDIMLIDVHLGEYERDGLDLLMAFRVQGFEGYAVAFSFDRSVRQIYRALAAGADDYWYKGPNLNPVFEVVDLLTRKSPVAEAKWEPDNIARLGYWRTIGATEGEVVSVVEYARSFGHYHDLAGEMGRSDIQLRKTMSNVKQKCDVRSLAEFGQLLTLCELMGSRPPHQRESESTRE